MERPGRTVHLGREIEAFTRHSLGTLLQEYRDVFTFGPDEMPGIDPIIIEHKLNVDATHKPVI